MPGRKSNCVCRPPTGRLMCGKAAWTLPCVCANPMPYCRQKKPSNPWLQARTCWWPRPHLLANAAPPATPQDLLHLPTLGLGNAPEDALWALRNPAGEQVMLPHRPRLVVDDMASLLCAALAGVGCAVLPRMLAADALARGELLEVLPGWAPPAGQVQAAFATRRGMRPAVRQVLDALAAEFQALERKWKMP